MGVCSEAQAAGAVILRPTLRRGIWVGPPFPPVFTASPLDHPRPFFNPPVHPAPPPCSCPGPVMVSRSARGRALIHGLTSACTALPAQLSPSIGQHPRRVTATVTA